MPEKAELTVDDRKLQVSNLDKVLYPKAGFTKAQVIDYYIRIAVRHTRDYERLLRERLYRIPGIRHSKPSFVLRRLKESLIPLSTAPVAEVVGSAGTPSGPQASAHRPATQKRSSQSRRR